MTFKVTIDADLEDLIPGYLENRNKDILEMKKMLQGEHFSEISQLAHKVKGTGAGYGFDLLTEFAKKIELSAKNEDQEMCESFLEQMKNYLSSLDIDYK